MDAKAGEPAASDAQGGPLRLSAAGGQDARAGATAPRQQSPVGLWGLLLGLLALPTLGLTALPGLVCSAVGIRRRSHRAASWAGLLLSSMFLISAYVVLFDLPFWMPDAAQRPYANWHMRIARCPELPGSASNVRTYWMDGLFAKMLYVRFDAPAGDVERFFEDLRALPALVIGDGESDVRVVSGEQRREMLDRLVLEQGVKGAAAARERHDDPAGRLMTVHLNAAPSWWSPVGIRRGLAYERPGGENGIRVFYDADSGTVYFWWHHS